MTAVVPVAAGVLFLAAYMGLILGLRAWARWAVRQQEGRDAAATFEAEYIPDAHDVAATEADLPELRDIRDEAERLVLAEDMVVDLEEAIAHVEGLRR